MLHEKTLKLRRESYFDLYEYAGEAYISFTRTLNIVAINLRALNLLGFTREDSLEHSLSLLFPSAVREEQTKRLLKSLDERAGNSSSLSESSADDVEGIELKFCRADGSDVPVRCFFIHTPIDTVSVYTAKLLLDTKNDTSQSALQKALEALKVEHEQLQRALTTKDAVLGMAAHDLRNPLNSIRLSIELLLENDLLDSESKNLLGIMQGATDTMLALLNDLLDVSIFEQGKIKLSKNIINVQTFFAELYDAWKIIAEHKGIVLTLIVPEGVKHATFDSKRIRQVIENLLSNAIKFSKSKTSVQLLVFHQGDTLGFEIKDQGPGIPISEQSKIFSPFQKLTPRPTGGETSTGLGLSLCKKIVDLHGGQISFESRVGVGSTFTVLLPESSPF